VVESAIVAAAWARHRSTGSGALAGA
jgi:hypothetical protein